MNRARVESAREVYDSVKVREKNPKRVWRNDEVKAAVRRMEAAWKKMLASSDEETKERCMGANRESKIKEKRQKRCMEVYTEEKRKVERCMCQGKKKVNGQFGRKMNEDVN